MDYQRLKDSGGAADHGSQYDRSQGITVEWKNVSLHVPAERPAMDKVKDMLGAGDGTHPETCILDGVSGRVEPGHFLAILGGSGSGKTSLLNVIAGRADGRITGDVFFNQNTFTPDDRKMFTGYVMQDDTLLPYLSVRETLTFSAKLRLPRTMSDREKADRVEGVIAELGLLKCAATRVGNQFVRGVSGGERRRVTVGTQLIMRPNVMFLDEPTSGLDAFTALSTVQVVRNLASANRTVLCTIHQPRSDLFEMFDRILLLSGGQTVYFGAASEMVEYFSKLGHQCPTYANPLDFAVDLVTVDHTTLMRQTESEIRLKQLVSACEAHLKALGPPSQPGTPRDKLLEPRKQASVWTQFLVLLNRSGKNLLRNKHELVSSSAMYLFLGLVLGTIYYDLPHTYLGMRDKFSLFYSCAVQLPFIVILSAVTKVCVDRPMYYRESRDGMYGPFPYYMAKLVSEAPLYFFQSMIYSVMIFFLTGCEISLERAMLFLLSSWFVVNGSIGLALMLAAAIPDLQQASFAANFVYTLCLLPAGFLVNINTIPKALGWISNISYIHYGLEALARSEFVGTRFCPVEVEGDCPVPEITGEEALKMFDLNHDDTTTTSIVLVAIIFLFHAVGYLATRFLPQKPVHH